MSLVLITSNGQETKPATIAAKDPLREELATGDNSK